MTAALALSTQDAVPLAHALAWTVARDHGIRALVIKGPAASHHGLREARVSADADLWVEPARVDAYLAALAELGWHEGELSRASLDLGLHSATLSHPQWPCTLDIHRTFPGFLAGPGAAFDALWQRRTALPIVGVEAPIPDRAGSFLIAALHALRSPHHNPRHAHELQRLVDAVIPSLSEAQRREVLDLAVLTGAVDTARPALAHLGVDLPPATPHGRDPQLDAWRMRTVSSDDRTSMFVAHLRTLPWRARPAAFGRALWPTEADFRVEHTEAPPGWWAGVRGRIGRLGTGMRAVPAVVRGARLARRGVTDDALLSEPARHL